MAAVEKRSISLTSDLNAVIDDAVASGQYGNASEVVRDALRDWKERKDLLGYTLEELQVLMREGVESGDPKPVDPEFFNRIKARARARHSSE